MENQILSLFPTPVGLYNLEKPLTDSEKSFIMNLERRPNMGNHTSVLNYLLDEKKLSRLKIFFNEAVNHYFNEVFRPQFDVKLKITQCWANYSEKGQWHHLHAHPNSFVSGVFYVNSDKQKDKIFFHKSGFKQIDIPHEPENWNIFNSDAWWIPTIENQLILFPSSLSHNVDPVESDKTRVSISLNTFPIGFLGDSRTLTECILEKETKKGKK